MPLMLRTQLPEEISSAYTHHNSAGEHTMKQSGEIPDINELRIGRGETPFERKVILDLMEAAGVVGVHTKLADSGMGPTIGYVVSRRNSQERSIDVLDLYVAEKHRSKGIGGFLLGNLLTQMIPVREGTRGVSIQDYGVRATLLEKTYRLPGRHLLASAEVLGIAAVDRLYKEMPQDWSGILEIEGEDSYEARLYVGGKALAEFEKIRPDDWDDPIMYRTAGGKQTYSHIAFAAIGVLNRELPGIV